MGAVKEKLIVAESKLANAFNEALLEFADELVTLTSFRDIEYRARDIFREVINVDLPEHVDFLKSALRRR